jgi:hypothetical protein
MSGTTAGGWPYVTPDDHPVEFPAHSQALANKLEAGGTVATVPLTAPWTNYLGPLKATRYGSLVTVEGFVRHTAGFAVVASTLYTVGTLPTGFRPVDEVNAAGMVSYNGTNTGFVLTRVNVYTNGAVSWMALTAGTVTANGGWFTPAVTFRAA